MRLFLLFLSWAVLCPVVIQSSLSYDWYDNTISPGEYTDYADIYDLPNSYGSYSEQDDQEYDYDYPYSADTTAYASEAGLEQSTLGSSPYESGISYDLASTYQPTRQDYTNYEPMSIYNVPYEDSLNEDDYLSYSDYQDNEYHQPYLNYDTSYNQEATEFSDSVSKYHTPDYYAAYDAYMDSPDAYHDSYGPVEYDHLAERKSRPLVVNDEKNTEYRFDDDIFSNPLYINDDYYYEDDEYNAGYGLDDPIDQRNEPIFYRHHDHNTHTLHDQIPKTDDFELKDAEENFAVPSKPREPIAQKYDRYGKDQSSLVYVPHRNRRYAHRFPTPFAGHTRPDFENTYTQQEVRAWTNPKAEDTYDSVSGDKMNHKTVDTSPETYGHLGRDQAWNTYDKYSSAESNLNNEPVRDWYPTEVEKEKMFIQHYYKPQHHNEDDDKAYKMKGEYDDFTFMKRKKMPSKQSSREKESYNDISDLQKLYEDEDDHDKKEKIYGQHNEENSDKELLHDVNYRLKSGIMGEGKFVGYSAQEKGKKYHEVTEYHHGGSVDKHGKHKTRYGGYDTYGSVKQYGEENERRKHMIEGSLKAQGGGDGYENGYIRGKLNRMDRQETDKEESDNIKVKGSTQTRPVRRRSRYGKRRSHKKRHGSRNTEDYRYKQY